MRNSVKLTSNYFSDNRAVQSQSGAGIYLDGHNTVIDKNIFVKHENSVILITESINTVISNSIFVANTASNIIVTRDSIYFVNDNENEIHIYNSTIAFNHLGENTANVLTLGLNSTIENSIIWDNSPAHTQPWLNGFQVNDGAIQITNSIVEYGYYNDKSDNVVDADPQFVRPEAGDYRVLLNSPAIDSGIDLGELGITSDITGNNRPSDGNADDVEAFDMGAFER